MPKSNYLLSVEVENIEEGDTFTEHVLLETDLEGAELVVYIYELWLRWHEKLSCTHMQTIIIGQQEAYITAEEVYLISFPDVYKLPIQDYLVLSKFIPKCKINRDETTTKLVSRLAQVYSLSFEMKLA